MQNDILNNYFSDITCEVLHSIGVWTLQELLDTGAEKLMATRGIGKGRFMQIAEVMVNVCGQNREDWKWNPHIRKEEQVMSKKSGKKQQKAVVYRIIDLNTLEVVYVGSTKDVTKKTLRRKLELLQKEQKMDSLYIMDCIFTNEKSEEKLTVLRERFFNYYKPKIGKSNYTKFTETATADDMNWTVFFSENHDGYLENKAVFQALDKAGRLRQFERFPEFEMLKRMFSEITNFSAMDIPTIPKVRDVAAERILSADTGLVHLLKTIRQEFIRLIDDKYEGKFPSAVVCTNAPAENKETPEEQEEQKSSDTEEITEETVQQEKAEPETDSAPEENAKEETEQQAEPEQTEKEDILLIPYGENPSIPEDEKQEKQEKQTFSLFNPDDYDEVMKNMELAKKRDALHRKLKEKFFSELSEFEEKRRAELEETTETNDSTELEKNTFGELQYRKWEMFLKVCMRDSFEFDTMTLNMREYRRALQRTIHMSLMKHCLIKRTGERGCHSFPVLFNRQESFLNDEELFHIARRYNMKFLVIDCTKESFFSDGICITMYCCYIDKCQVTREKRIGKLFLSEKGYAHMIFPEEVIGNEIKKITAEAVLFIKTGEKFLLKRIEQEQARKVYHTF